MIKHLIKLSIATILLVSVSCKSSSEKEREEEGEENEKYDNPAARDLQEFNKTKDPATGTVPIERLWTAQEYTLALKDNYSRGGITGVWEERGPIYDSVGPSNGNGRGGVGFTGGYTSGRIKGFLVDAADPSGNTVFCGGANGGLWKCTNFTSTTTDPNWVPVNEYMNNMSIVSMCQNPVNKDIMYAATGLGFTNGVDMARGKGVFKSIDHGVTWTNLAVTASITNCFKIMCDASGNVYWATVGSGLRRSTNGGTSFTTITPSGANTTCTDIEISSTGKLHASFGYRGSTVVYKFANNPATVSSTSWGSATGIGTAASRLELACKGDTVYGVTVLSSGYADYCYRSVNGGATFTKMNGTVMTTDLTGSQGWYAISLAVNPKDANQFIVGSLDAYLSTDGGASINKITSWVNGGTYVHADHQAYQWWLNTSGESRLLIGSDGGLSYSEDDGATFVDKNKNLGLKQFYSCAIHPTKTNYILGGAQDNGVHQLKNAGLSYSIEVTGGDGGYVDIDNDQPQYQFGSYVYNVYRRSSNNGATWTNFDFSNNRTTTAGDFINTYDYDDVQNVFFAANGSGDFWRWTNPQTAGSVSGSTRSVVPLAELGGMASAITVSPYKTGRAFFGGSGGNVVMVNNTKTTTGTGSADVVDLNAPGGGNTNCIAVGTNDSNLLAVYSNYGINNLFITNDMGANWTAIDGNLPDMPILWAVFHPTLNNAIVIGTETGVFTTTNVNGAATIWTVSPGFPLVRVNMLKLRKSDNAIVAATYGRGMWTSNILNLLPLKKINLLGKLEGENNTQLNWEMIDATSNAKYFLEYSEDGVHFKQIAKTGSTIHSFKHQLTSDIGYYRIMGVEPNSSPIYSNIIAIKSLKNNKGLQINIAPNPMKNNGSINIKSTNAGNYSWKISNVQGNIIQAGNGVLQIGDLATIPANIGKLSAGMYVVSITQANQTKAASFIKQ